MSPKAIPRTGPDDGEELVTRLYRDHGRSLFAYAARLTDDPAFADDVVQETLTKAWRDRMTVTADAHGRRELLTVARDLVVAKLSATAARPANVNFNRNAPPAFRDQAEATVAAVVALEAVASAPPSSAPPHSDVVLHRALRQVRAETDARRSYRGVVTAVAAAAVVLALLGGVLAGRELSDDDQAAPPAPPAAADGGAAATADFATVQAIVKNRRTRLGRIPNGSFANSCTMNHRNSDNFILSPGVPNSANHLHDYYGNGTTNAYSTVESLRTDSQSECRDPTDVSAYWMPTLLRNDQPVQPDLALFIQRGYDRDVGEVVPTPQGLKMITGMAKATTAAQSNAQFTCTGSTAPPQRTLPDCPDGSRLVRIQDFPSCWDGVHLDSKDHRSHVVFPRNGTCPAGNPVPLPRLRFMLVYPLSNTDGISVSSNPVARGLSFSDHADVVNLYPTRRMVSGVQDCINTGIDC